MWGEAGISHLPILSAHIAVIVQNQLHSLSINVCVICAHCGSQVKVVVRSVDKPKKVRITTSLATDYIIALHHL
jgi:hypothetical protein